MKSLEHKREKLLRRGLTARMRLGALMLCLALLTGLLAGAAAEQADPSAAMLEALRGRTYYLMGSAGDCCAVSFCRDGRTVVFTDTIPDDYWFVYQAAGVIDGATALHEHVLSLHVAKLSVIRNAAFDYEGHPVDVSEQYSSLIGEVEKTLLIALPGADAGELDGRGYGMTVEQFYAGIDDDDLFDNYPYDSATTYIADLSNDGNGFMTPFCPQTEAIEEWYRMYWLDDDPLDYAAEAPEENPMPVQVIGAEENPMPVQVIEPEENSMPVQVIEPEENSLPVQVIGAEESPMPVQVIESEENSLPVQVIGAEESPMPVQVIESEENSMPVQVIEPEYATASDGLLAPELDGTQDDAQRAEYVMACADYARVLRYNEAEIRAYWQDGRRFSYDRGTPECRPVALADITDDGIPELIFIRYDARFDTSWLHVFTHRDGVTKQLYYTYLEQNGEEVSCLYQHPMNGDLCAILKGEKEAYCHWAYRDGKLAEERLCRYEDGNGPHFIGISPGPDGYPVEQEMDRELFDKGVQMFTQTPKEVLLYSAVGSDGTARLDGRASYGFMSLPCASMRFDEALGMLEREGAPAEVLPDDASGQTLPAGVFGQTITHFSSKNSGTSLTIQADGTFEIYSYDVETLVRHSGRIDSVRRISPHGYELHVAEAGEGTEGAWEMDDIAPGKTIVMLLPYADESEITGTLCPTDIQDYNCEETAYVPGEFYIGVTRDSDEMLFKPF